MGVYVRPDSPFYWILLDGFTDARGRPLREKTKILRDASSAELRKANRKLAEALYFERMAECGRGTVRPGVKPPRTFAEQAAWFSEHLLPKRKGREREGEILPRLVRTFGAYQLRAITRELVTEKWITPRSTQPTVVKKAHRTAARTVQAGPRTINREVSVLKAVMQSAVPTYLEVSPVYGMKLLKAPTPKRRLMTEEEEKNLLAVMAPDDKALFLLALDSLVRMGDVLDLKRSDDGETSVWIADPKAGGGFSVPVSKRTRKALDKIPTDGTEYYFSRRRRAETARDRRNGIRRMLKRYCEAAGVPYGRRFGGLTFHWGTRRTGTTRMLTRGVDIGTVQKVGRWKTPGVVLGIYHELLDEKAAAAVESVGRKPRRRQSRDDHATLTKATKGQ